MKKRYPDKCAKMATIEAFLVPFEDTDLEPTEPITRVGWGKQVSKRTLWLKKACVHNRANELWQLLVEWGMDPNKLILMRGMMPTHNNDDDSDDYAQNDYLQMSPLEIIILFETPESLKCLEILLRAGANPTLPGFRTNGNISYDAITYLCQQMSLRTSTMAKAEFYLKMLARLLSHSATLGPISTSTDPVTGKQALDYALCSADVDAPCNNFACLHGVAMLLETGTINTLRGSLIMALRHIKNTDLCVQVCRMLLEAGVDVNERVNMSEDKLWEQDTALMAAASRPGDDCLRLTRLLLDDVPGVDPNVFVGTGKGILTGSATCLWAAAAHSRHARELLRLLLTHGANPYAENDDGVSVLEQIYLLDPSQGDAIMDALSTKHRRRI